MAAPPGQVYIGTDPTGKPVYGTPVSAETAQRQDVLTKAAAQGHIVPELGVYQPGNVNYPKPAAPQEPQNQQVQTKLPDLSNVRIVRTETITPQAQYRQPGETERINVPVPDYRVIGYTSYKVSETEVRSEYGSVQKPETGKVFDVEAIVKGTPGGSFIEKVPGGVVIKVPEWAALPPGMLEKPGTSLYVRTQGGITQEKGVISSAELLGDIAAKEYMSANFGSKITAVGHTLFSEYSKPLFVSQIKTGTSEYTGKPRLVLAINESAAAGVIGKDIIRRYTINQYLKNLPSGQRDAETLRIWQEGIGTSLTQSVPGTIITSYAGGLVLGKVFSVAPSVLGTQAAKAASYTFGGLMTGALVGNVVSTITSTRLTGAEKAVELAVVGGAVWAGYEGFKEGPNVQSPIGAGKVKSEQLVFRKPPAGSGLTKAEYKQLQGSDVIYEGIYLQKGYKIQPIIGESGGKIILGMPKTEQIALEPGALPELRGNIGRSIGIQALKGIYSPEEIVWKTKLFTLSSTLVSQKSAFTAKTLELERLGLDPKQAKIFVKTMSENAKIAMIRGSAGENIQLPESFRSKDIPRGKSEGVFGKVGDIDIQVGKSKEQTFSLAENIYQQYKAAGYKITISSPEEVMAIRGRKTATTIINIETSTRKLIPGDIKSGLSLSFKPIGSEEYVYLGGKQNEIGEGIYRTEPIKIQKVSVQTLGEQLGYRYVLTTTPQLKGFGPLASRAPSKGKLDVPRLPIDIESQLQSREASIQQVINPFYKAETSYLRNLQTDIYGAPTQGTIITSDTTGLITQPSAEYAYSPYESYYGGKKTISPEYLSAYRSSRISTMPSALSGMSTLPTKSAYTAPISPTISPIQAPKQSVSASTFSAVASPFIGPQRPVPSRMVGSQYIFIPLNEKQYGYGLGMSGQKRGERKRQPIGRVAWKQGAVYKVWYAPFGQKNVRTTRRPLEGVQYYKGFRSATKSAVRRGGVVPEKISRTMGIVRLTARTPRDKPSLMFKSRSVQTKKVRKGGWLGL